MRGDSGRIGRLVVLSVGILFVASGAGCSPDEDRAADGADVTLEETAPPQPEPAGTAAGALTDPQVAHVAVTANTIDVEFGQLALARTTNAEVRSFAETMVADHTAVNERAAALAQRLGVTPEVNAVSESLRRDADAARAELERLSGGAFDRAYMEREVAYHQAVLDAIDQTLVPNTTNQELRALLTEVRPVIEAHLERARTILSTLPPG